MDMVAESMQRESDRPWDLPEGWAWVELRDIGNWTSGGTPKSTEPDYYDGPVPWFRITELNEGRLRKSEKSLTVRGLEESSAKIIQAPFLMFAMYGASIGKMAISEIDASTNQAIACCSPSQVVDIDFLFLALQRLKRKIIALGQGGAQPNISQRILLECAIPLAPLAEQRRIVARVAALFAEIAEGEAALEAARKGLEIFRRALLKAAVTGELTKVWRENNPVTETGHDLLARIKADRAAKGQTKGRGKRAADAPPLDTSALPELPEGWAWGTLGEILLGIEAGLNVSAEGRPPVGDETGIVKVSAVTWGEFDENASKALPTRAVVDPRDLIEVGDFLFSRANTLELVGAPVIVKSINKRLVLSDKILRFRLMPGTEPWLEVVLKSAFGRQQIESRATGAQLSMRNISQDSIRGIPIPIPPPLETAEILRRVSEALAARADTLSLLDAEAADAARLKQSILKAAFEGRLVPQDPADEPASVTLARLRATSCSAAPARRGRSRRP